jgi:hypothetical protein
MTIEDCGGAMPMRGTVRMAITRINLQVYYLAITHGLGPMWPRASTSPNPPSPLSPPAPRGHFEGIH